MAQQTNLNVSPYFDDFDSSNDYYKVLFKPGYPVQARELTGLQSILQNQIEQFGSHVFKEGAKVIPGNTTFDTGYTGVSINATHLGVPVSAYLSQLVGKRIYGLTTGITAEVVNFITPEQSDFDITTLYISYLSSGVGDNAQSEFNDGELLACDENIVSGPENSVFVPAGESFASTLTENSVTCGAVFSVDNGVYFIRGNFVNVAAQTIILDQYDNLPTGRIGFNVQESIINADEDPTLADNSKGFNNYAAPGADRLRIKCTLAFKDYEDLNDNNFVELAKVDDGVLQTDFVNDTSQYNLLRDELARRTFAESGDYTVTAFGVEIRDSLNDNLGNDGVYPAGQDTPDGRPVSDDVGLYAIAPGKAFVRGYEVRSLDTAYVSFPKTRDSAVLENQAVNYNTGVTIRANNIKGAPEIGVGNTYIVSLRDQRAGVSTNAPGEEIGLARIYDCALESGSYDTEFSTVNQWDVSLFDVRLQTNITLNEPIPSLSVPTFIKGKYSGSTAFLRDTVTDSTSLKLYDTVGTFLKNEPLIFNGIEDTRVALAVTGHSIADVKAIYGGPSVSVGPGVVGVGLTFVADTIQKDSFFFGQAQVTDRVKSTGISTVTSISERFPGDLKVGNILAFTNTGIATAQSTQTLARIVSVGSSQVTITGVTTVSKVSEGSIPQVGAANIVSVSDLRLISTPLAEAGDNRLYTEMPKRNISNVDLSDAQLIIRKSYDVVITTNNELNSGVVAGDNETFLAFDEERYSLVRRDGTTEVLTSDKLAFTSGNTVLQVNNIGADLSANMEAKLVTTLKKIKPKAKLKRKNRVNTLVVNTSKLTGSGVGATTLNDGLSYGNYPYGTRVQDERISLNTGDIIEILGVFESNNTAQASAPRLTLTSISGPTGKTSDLIIGEKITGQTSGSIAVVAEKVADQQLSYIDLNDFGFSEGETVTFEESGLQAVISSLDIPSKDVSANYTFNNGQKSTFYDYGFLTRNSNAKEPTKQLKIYFKNGYYEASDDGDITTHNSYNTFEYGKEIQTVNGNRNTDVIDIRPKVSDYIVAENTRSPLEFLGRSFTASGNSAANILASDESIVTNYSFYGGRIDRLYINDRGDFEVKLGNPAENPEKPDPIDNALEIATITLPPYLYNTEDASIHFLDHKRYTMRDIGKLEDRIRNLEYYTSLSILETETANLFVPDNSGLNKFKSGFFVDNFTSFLPQEDSRVIKNSIDQSNKECRPSHYTNSIDLVVGPVDPSAEDLTLNASAIFPEGTNTRKTGDIVTLDYEEVEYLAQEYATRTESVTPFLLSFWRANIKLTPASDTWTDTARIKAKVIDVEGNYASTVDIAARQFGGFDPQTGLTPVLWNAWQTQWTGTRTTVRRAQRTEVTGRRNFSTNTSERGGTRTNRFQATTRTTFQDTFTDNFRTGIATRTGRRQLITPQLETESLGDRTVSREVISFMRSRNIEFVGRGFKSLTQVYPFFEGIDVSKFCIPKLLEVQMLTGSFQVGETVFGRPIKSLSSGGASFRTGMQIRFRLCQPNHKSGPYNAPERIYASNPYTSTVGAKSDEAQRGEFELFALGDAQALPSTYSATSTILNVDTLALAEQPAGAFFGYVETGMILYGATSGARARIVNNRLVTDLSSDILGSFFIPSPRINANPKFTTGTKTFVLIDNKQNDENTALTLASETYTASGTLETVQESIVSVRNAKVEVLAEREQVNREEFTGTTTTTTAVGAVTTTVLTGTTFTPPPPPPDPPRWTGGGGGSPPATPPRPGRSNTSVGHRRQPVVRRVRRRRVVRRRVRRRRPARRRRGGRRVSRRRRRPNRRRRVRNRRRRGRDPIAQSFTVFGDTGVFLTSIDIFFAEVDTNDIPVVLQLRTMENGIPTETILPFSEVTLPPSEIEVSADGDVGTRIFFDAPVYVEEQTEYAMVLVSASTKYKVWISRVGENDKITDQFVSTQPDLGSFFKSQNGSTWEPSQWEDLKFVINRARFSSSGTMELYSPVLAEGNAQVPTLMPDPINLTSRKVRVGLTTGLNFANNGSHVPELGNTIYQINSNATGNYVGSAGSATGNLNLINTGIGFTPHSGSGGYDNTSLSNITGLGQDLKADIHVVNGVVAVATVRSGGSGYTVGDVLELSSGLGNQATGRNARFSIVSIGATNELILDNVQGDFITGIGNTIMFTNSVGIGTTLGGVGAAARVSSVTTVSDGLHIVVDHKNHGMHHETNRVILSDIEPDVIPTKISVAYDSSSTGDISIDDPTEFGTFENVGVGTTNAGYLLIGDEILSYTESTGNTLGGITRQIDGTSATDYPAGTPIYKYELGGVSLRRINKEHALSDVTVNNPITFDSYNVKVDMATSGIARTTGESFPILYFDQTKSTGGFSAKATQNMQYEIITPQIQNLTLPGTNINATMRSISGTSLNDGSADGADLPFVVQDREALTLNNSNYLTSPRIIASRVNETNAASLQDLPGERSLNISLELTTDSEFLSPVIDTQRLSAIFTTNRVDAPITNYAQDNRVNSLNDDPTSCQYISKENTLENPASSLKVILDAHINNYADIRVFYAISETPNFDPIFVPFPGFDNLNDKGEIIAIENSNGKSDTRNVVSDVSGFASQDLDFREYTFTADNLPSFKSFRVKVVMTSTNQTYPPRMKDLRVIATA